MTTDTPHQPVDNDTDGSQRISGTRKRAIAIAIVVLVIAAASLGGILLRASRSAQQNDSSSKEESGAGEADVVTLSAEAQRNVGLTLEAAQVKAVLRTIQATGVVGPNETRVAHVRPLARGRIEKVYVRLGDRVQAGQPLVAYDNIELGELISEYLGAKSARAKANAEAEVSKRSVERAQKLIELGAGTKAEFERRDADHKSAIASINMHSAQIAMIEQKLRRFGMSEADTSKLEVPTDGAHSNAAHTIQRSPFDGIVIKSEVAEGEVVNSEREMFTIADISTVWVQADVYEKDIAFIRQGQEVKISVAAYPGESFKGKITYVTDFLDPKTRTAKVRCEVPNPHRRLKLEMFASIQIPTAARREALMIPASSVQQVEDKPVVFVKVGDAEFQKREVQLGPESDGWVEVTSGLTPGEIVAAVGSFYLKSALLKDQISGDD